MSFKFNPLTGSLDLVNAKESASVITKVAGETMSALKWVVLSDLNTVVLANTDTYPNSKVIGITTVAALVGEEITVQTFGLLEDSFFNYTLNEPIFLGTTGSTITDPTLELFTMNVGHGVGAGAIFIDIKEQVEIC